MRLLLAEDEKELSRALTAILKHNHYSVDAVYDGEEALDYALTENYDGIILDIMMPKMDGITVLKKLRQNKIDIPVLMLTAKAEIDDRILGLDEGADDYLTKPFVMGELLARIRAMTRRRSKDFVPNLLTYGNLWLDKATFELGRTEEKDGASENTARMPGAVKLSNKEFQMMEMLMSNPRQLLSMDQFMDRIWGYDSETDMNVIWVYISYLRKKLKKLGADFEITMQRGVGYKLSEPGSGRR